MKILIVDDKPENLYLLEALLGGNGFQTTSAHNGAEALGLALNDTPDLIISDILMPVMDGYKLCRECKKNSKLSKIPFVFYTATYTTHQDEEFALSLGADRFIIKPEDPDVFLSIITKLLTEVSEKKITPKEPVDIPEGELLKEYNAALIRKLEDKMNQTNLNEKSLKLHIIALEKNIADRKKAEDNLAKSENQFRLVWEKSFDGMRLINEEGITILVNKAFCELVELDESQIIGKPASVIYLREEQDRIQSALMKNIKNSSIETMIEKELILHNNRKVWFEMSNSFIDTGSSTILLSVARDITENKKMIAELVGAKMHAEEINRIKSSFFANMSHELRTPLIGILGFSEIMMNRTDIDSEMQEMNSYIHRGGLRLLNTLDLILSFSNLESKNQEVNLEKVDLVPVIKETFDFFTTLSHSETIEFSFNNLVDSAFCSVDLKLLDIILRNLINNAIKFTDKGKITLTLEKEVDHLLIRVADTGIGISTEKQNIIWDAFRQASEGYGRNFEGTGLGLTLSRKYTELMGGTISMKSEEGKGSEFTIEFPLAKNDSDLIVQTEVKVPVPSPEAIVDGLNFRVLYVEDDIFARTYVSRILAGKYKLDMADSADIAFEKVKWNVYDLILMDINLSRGLDGIQLTRIIRDLPAYKSTPIVAITAYAMEHEKNEFLSKGFTHYIPKPFTKIQLLQLIDKIISNISLEG